MEDDDEEEDTRVTTDTRRRGAGSWLVTQATAKRERGIWTTRGSAHSRRGDERVRGDRTLAPEGAVERQERNVVSPLSSVACLCSLCSLCSEGARR